MKRNIDYVLITDDNGDVYHKCKKCEYKTKNSKGMHQHLRIYKDREHKRVEKKSKYKRVLVDGVIRFECEVCNKIYKSYGSLYLHNKTKIHKKQLELLNLKN